MSEVGELGDEDVLRQEVSTFQCDFRI
jgi:hypothetical protein